MRTVTLTFVVFFLLLGIIASCRGQEADPLTEPTISGSNATATPSASPHPTPTSSQALSWEDITLEDIARLDAEGLVVFFEENGYSFTVDELTPLRLGTYSTMGLSTAEDWVEWKDSLSATQPTAEQSNRLLTDFADGNADFFIFWWSVGMEGAPQEEIEKMAATTRSAIDRLDRLLEPTE